MQAMPEEKAVHILLVEDDIDLCKSLTSYLNGSGFSVTAVGSCFECYQALPTANFAVAIVDVTLPDQSGFVLAEYLRTNTFMKIIILTAHERVEDRIRGYGAGAHNYFVKPVDGRELKAAIMSLVDSDLTAQPGSPLPSGPGWRLFRQSWRLQSDQGKMIKLTSLELQFLEMLISTTGMVVQRDTLLNGLYNRNDEHSRRALDSLVRRLRAKIEDSDQMSPIKTAHGVGYCFAAPITIC